MFGWNILLTKPMLGDLYGYWSGSSTCTFHLPSENGAIMGNIGQSSFFSCVSTNSTPQPKQIVALLSVGPLKIT